MPDVDEIFQKQASLCNENTQWLLFWQTLNHQNTDYYGLHGDIKDKKYEIVDIVAPWSTTSQAWNVRLHG